MAQSTADVYKPPTPMKTIQPSFLLSAHAHTPNPEVHSLAQASAFPTMPHPAFSPLHSADYLCATPSHVECFLPSGASRYSACPLRRMQLTECKNEKKNSELHAGTASAYASHGDFHMPSVHLSLDLCKLDTHLVA
ncbi:hypothetical protein A0H81_13899 [Grifola frondosa]|uniref:Uncharacterized protein n=1 Tax=Grifola frondosa TaxID=5627 RepID=A0A1C7LNC8_GRIFR|nr:hypothetical protein A0H81_13899 [Grifola frondosa]